MSRKKVMLVDDSSTVIMMEKMILSRGPYELVVARDGQEAVEKAPQERPDLILLDLMMPRLGGMETCEQLRKHEVTASTPIIIVTTRDEEANVERAFAAGCNDYITKPISAIELLTKVRNQLQ
jgi:CheY-like chemotaxis protein